MNKIDAQNTQFGVVGDDAHIEGGVHFHSVVSPADPIERRNRARMLQLVDNTWVKGVFEQSLHGVVMLDLGKDYNTQAVERPWDLELYLPGKACRAVPHGTSVRDLFDQCSGTLLILGEPGSGKTTTLLELARDLIALAARDETCPIPVVFNLSSWADKQLPLEQWLLDELNTKYRIPKKIAQAWIEKDLLLLLLDGLDEVKASARDKSVLAINAFLASHLVPLAVCCRSADYESLAFKLRFHGAISLRPLSPQQIDVYLTGAGDELRAVRTMLQHDPILQEIAQSPLMLSIMTLAYRGLDLEGLQTLVSPETRREHLFNTYIRRMFRRRVKDQPHTPEQTCCWLAWLAEQMTEHKQTLFLIENLQPDWLPERGWLHIWAALLAGSLTGLVCWAVFGFLLGMPFGLLSGLLGGIAVAIYVGFVDTVRPVEALAWSRHDARFGPLHELLGALLVSVVVGAVGGPLIGVVSGALGGLSGEIIGRLRSVRMQVRTFPNQGILQSARNVGLVGLAGALILGLVGGFAGTLRFGLFVGLTCAVLSGLLGGLLFSLIVGLIFWGGVPVILHFSLRAQLFQSGYAPWPLARFLDYCAARILLRKVGGGYIFIHRLLQEHFAAMDPADCCSFASAQEHAVSN